MSTAVLGGGIVEVEVEVEMEVAETWEDWDP